MTEYCDFNNAQRTCPVCGLKAKYERMAAACTGPRRPQPWRPVMVGDLVERALTAVGITQPLVERLTRTGGKPGGCGCESRKRWMNEAGVRLQLKARDALLATRDFYLGK